MVESFFALSRDDQREVLEVAREKTDRPTHLLEKDVWVVWTLGALGAIGALKPRPTCLAGAQAHPT